MKRSEMLEILHKALTFELGHDYTEKLEEIVLEVVEKAGMSPPDHDGTVFTFNEGLVLPPEWEKE